MHSGRPAAELEAIESLLVKLMKLYQCTDYAITVGSGGAPAGVIRTQSGAKGLTGGTSVFDTITSAGGGGGGGYVIHQGGSGNRIGV